MMLQPGLARKAAVALALLLGAALAALPLTGHFDDSDSMLYRLLARHFAERGRWLDPSYLPAVHPHYREHLPFGLWPWGAADRLLGEWSLVPLALLCSLALLALLIREGQRHFGLAAAIFAAVALASTESFFHYAAAPHLDRLLLLFSFASVAPLLPAGASWGRAAAFAALATLVKGPFGLLPLVAAAFARGELFRGALATLVAALPAAAFLAGDKFIAGGSWYSGYFVHQLLASASGERGGSDFLLPFASVASRFWPALPFTLWGGVKAVRALSRRQRTPLTTLFATCLFLLLLLCLPARKSWHHAMIAWPLLALLAGAGAADLLSSQRRARVAFAALAAAAAIALWAALGAAARYFPQTCVVPAELVAQLPRGSEVLVVSREPDWKFIAALAEEHRLLPAPAESLPPAGQARRALVSEPDLPRVLGDWREQGRAAGWVLLASPNS